MLRGLTLLIVSLLPLVGSARALAQTTPGLTTPAPFDPIAYDLALRGQIAQLAQQERELKLQGQPPAYRAQLIGAAAVGGAGLVTGGVTLATALLTVQCDCGPSLTLTRRLLIGSYSIAAVAGIWAITLTSIRKARTDRVAVRRLREQRRALQLEQKQLQRAFPARPMTLSLLLAPQQIGLRASY